MCASAFCIIWFLSLHQQTQTGIATGELSVAYLTYWRYHLSILAVFEMATANFFCVQGYHMHQWVWMPHKGETIACYSKYKLWQDYWEVFLFLIMRHSVSQFGLSNIYHCATLQSDHSLSNTYSEHLL